MLTQSQVKEVLETSKLDLALQRVSTGWFIQYRDGAGYFVCRGRGFIGPMTAGRALEAYKVRVFNHLFPGA